MSPDWSGIQAIVAHRCWTFSQNPFIPDLFFFLVVLLRSSTCLHGNNDNRAELSENTNRGIISAHCVQLWAGGRFLFPPFTSSVVFCSLIDRLLSAVRRLIYLINTS